MERAVAIFRIMRTGKHIASRLIYCIGILVIILVGCKQSKDASQMTVGELENAANKGNPQAQFRLGMLRLQGSGNTAEKIAAVSCLQKAAERGLREAQYHLALCYFNGEGVPRNGLEAL
jgi:TPR repeat protein